MRAALGLALLFSGGALAFMVLTGHAPFAATSAAGGSVPSAASGAPSSGTSITPGRASFGGGFGSGGGH